MQHVVRCTALRRFLGSDYGIFGIEEHSSRIVSTHHEYALSRFRDCGDIRFSFAHANADDCNCVSKTCIPRLEYSDKICNVKLAFDLYE